MSRDGSVVLPFADGDKVFKMGWGELVKLQEATDAGPYLVYTRLMSGTWKLGDISNTIRLGLIGGGMPVPEALTFVQSYVESRPPLESLPLAQGVLGTALQGAPDEPPGEQKGEGANVSTASPTENGGSASYTGG